MRCVLFSAARILRAADLVFCINVPFVVRDSVSVGEGDTEFRKTVFDAYKPGILIRARLVFWTLLFEYYYYCLPTNAAISSSVA